MPHTAETATAFVITAVEAKGTASRHDFDIPAIVTATHSLTETWDFHAVDQNMFWNIAATFLKH
ncbi:hypothetical protein ACIP5Y_11845 [Nocardia sp. NPDC088792]|uniref:hypothetical protein n=1 Tax=Nocardia sp. NPDC088792 TaxID=3364332 RepID=UPI003802BBF9